MLDVVRCTVQIVVPCTFVGAILCSVVPCTLVGAILCRLWFLALSWELFCALRLRFLALLWELFCAVRILALLWELFCAECGSLRSCR